jgi:hypothetical protein
MIFLKVTLCVDFSSSNCNLISFRCFMQANPRGAKKNSYGFLHVEFRIVPD